MSTSKNIRGWLFGVPATQSVGFFPASQDCVVAECLPWQNLLSDDENVLTDFIEKMHGVPLLPQGPCFCYYFDCSSEELSGWFNGTAPTEKNIVNLAVKSRSKDILPEH